MINTSEYFGAEKELFKNTCRTPDMADSRFNVLHINITISEKDVVKGARSILEVIRPKWNLDDVNFKLFTDGITNKLVGCFNGDKYEDVVLVRVYGNNTELLIDREVETRNIKLLHRHGFAPRLYATFTNGLAYEFVPGRTLSVDSIRLPAIWRLVARQLARLHRIAEHNPGNGAELWSKTQKYFDLVPEQYDDIIKQQRFSELISPISDLRAEFTSLYKTLKGLGSPVVFAHNDLLLGNIIYDEKNERVTFIDYEYAGYNYQAYDIGNHFAEFVGLDVVDYSRYPSKQFQLSWLHEYLQTYYDTEFVNDTEVLRLYGQVNKFCLASHFFWGIWALIQAQHSSIEFDFIGYAAIRFKEYYSKKEYFLSLES